MDNLSEIRLSIHNGAKINIIGDSLAAGGGSSETVRLEEVILVDSDTVYVRRNAPNSWWGKFQSYLFDKYPNCTVVNNGCGGIYSSQVWNNLHQLYTNEDDIIMILLGANDRKIQDGMRELYNNLSYIVQHFKNIGKQVVLLTPNPSTVMNESYENRLYHMEDVSNVVSQIALNENVLLVNNFNYIQEYLFLTNQKIDDIIFGENCGNDGLHPSDKVHDLIYRNLLNSLELSQKVI